VPSHGITGKPGLDSSPAPAFPSFSRPPARGAKLYASPSLSLDCLTNRPLDHSTVRVSAPVSRLSALCGYSAFVCQLPTFLVP
jgi:hypothetical protein